MKKLLGLMAGLAVLCPTTARADGWCLPWLPPYRVDAGAYFRVVPLNQPVLAPWYTYWPGEALAQMPGPLGQYPYWPGQQYGPNGGPTMHMPTPATSGLLSPPSGYQPAGSWQGPNYWYAR
jgi:hypothetical protein